jgi:hypothetical protein
MRKALRRIKVIRRERGIERDVMMEFLMPMAK